MKKVLRISFVLLALFNILIGIFTSIQIDKSFPSMDDRINIFDNNVN